ncbi:MAG TPA: DUF3159 domain-containing protein [Actinomycetes bacterium]|jgi:Protein of unknown function (DUF3159)|nr:DUF3159 domain-containing protein [Actinomycetes bacterium]
MTEVTAGAQPGSQEAAARAPLGVDTVEAVVRRQLAKALGGIRGTVEAAVPTAAFAIVWMATRQLELALGVSIGAAAVLLAARLVQRQTLQFVLTSMIGIAVAAFFALRSGKAEDAFLPGIMYNAVVAAVVIFSIIVRWPFIGFLIGSVTGDPTGWRKDPAIVRLCTRLTWLFVLPNVIRVAVQWPIYLTGNVGLLAAAKIALGWPLFVGALALMLAVLARGHTPVETPKQA